MSANDFSHLAALVFLIVCMLQLYRALAGLPVVLGSTFVPIWASWVAFGVAGLLAYLGFTAW